jgi:hypothetical protein
VPLPMLFTGRVRRSGRTAAARAASRHDPDASLPPRGARTIGAHAARVSLRQQKTPETRVSGVMCHSIGKRSSRRTGNLRIRERADVRPHGGARGSRGFPFGLYGCS